MIVKQIPDDFRVEEVTDVRPEPQGPFSFYRLEKTGWTTPDALAAVRRRWDIAPARMSYGGLKDRHAHTYQFLSILHGPRRSLNHERIRVEHLGQLHEPFTSRHIRANRFTLTLRGLSTEAVQHCESALAEVAEFGVPNYFDDQRFGSVQPGEPFIGRLLVAGDFEGALRLALLAPYEYDLSAQKKEKSLLRQHWGRWPHLLGELPRGHARSLVAFLKDHPDDFRGAVVRLRPELRGLYLSAYQSHLWNRILARWLETTLPADTLMHAPLRLGDVPMWRRLDAGQLAMLTGLTLPLPSARTKVAEEDPIRPLVESVLTEEGLTMRHLQVKGVRELFFSKGTRDALCAPAHLRWSSEGDELRIGKTKVTLAFELPRGAYATLIVKRITPRPE